MSKLKQNLIKGLSSFLLAGALLFPTKAKAQERIIINNFSQPNDTTLNYYGSGDVFLDNKLDQKDTYRLDSLIQGTFTDPSDNRLTDRADINGDEQVTIEDKQTLESYLNGAIPYLPSHWNKSNTAEKTSWFEKMVAIDKTDEEDFDICYKFSIPFAINFHGFESLANGVDPDFPWKFSKNNRFNIPVYLVSSRAIGDKAHAINGVLVGDNPFNFYDWYFIEPQNDKKINIGDWDMIKDSDVKINYTRDISEHGASSSRIIQFHIDENGTPSLYYNKPSIVKSNPNKDTIAPELNISLSKDNSQFNLEYLAKDYEVFLDSCRFKLNDAPWQYINCSVPYYAILAPVDSISGTIPLDVQEGENNLEFYVSDIAGNVSTWDTTFTVYTNNAVEKTTLEDYFKVYPNPVSNIGNFEFYLKTHQNIKLSIYDISGRQLEKILIEGHAGDNKVSYDFSKYKSGIYIYRFEGDKGNIKTGRVVKK